ncbi:MAG: serine hydrolase [Candidatus Saccharimonadales bacterium]
MLRHVKHTAHRVHHHINRHALWWVVFLVSSLIIALQLLYPLDRALPFSRLNGQSVSLQPYEKLAERIDRYFAESNVTLAAGDSLKISFAPGEAGIHPDLDMTVMRLTDYPVWQRLIPLSIFFVWPDVHSVDVQASATKQEVFVDTVLPKLNTLPQDAGLSIVEGNLQMKDDVPGTLVTKGDLQKALASARFGLVTTTIVVPSEALSAEKPSSYFDAVKHQAEAVIALPITIDVEEEVVTPSHSDIASWLAVGEDDHKQAMLTINDTALDVYLKTLQDKHTTAAGQTNITRVDGRETARVEGVPGRTIDVANLRQQVVSTLLTTKEPTLSAHFVAVEPTVVINRKYTSSQAGLQAYVSDQAATRNVRISVQQIGGSGWKAGARETETTVSASTYKLYVALMLFDKMDQGEITWDTPILGMSTRTCFEHMIVASTNACAEEWIRQFGAQNINNFIYSKGFSTGTSFTNPIANHTTTADLTRYFRGLDEGWLMSSEYRQYLLDALKRHHYTKGIPSGSAGEVHNKVGFLWDYSNDSAVVYHPRGTYVIAVMTKGLSFYAIAGITREIEAIMYP